MLDPIDIAAALKFYQTKRGLSLQDLAEKAGVCKYALGRGLKTGSFYLSTLAKLLTALDVDLYTFSLTATSYRGASNEATTNNNRPLRIPVRERKRRPGANVRAKTADH